MSDQKLDEDEVFKGVRRTLNIFMFVFTLIGFLLGFTLCIGIKHPDLNATIELKIEDK